MQDKMECDLFKPSKHDVIHLPLLKNIQLQNSQQTLNLKSTKIIVFSTIQQCTMECIQKEKVLNTSDKRTELEI